MSQDECAPREQSGSFEFTPSSNNKITFQILHFLIVILMEKGLSLGSKSKRLLTGSFAQANYFRRMMIKNRGSY